MDWARSNWLNNVFACCSIYLNFQQRSARVFLKLRNTRGLSMLGKNRPEGNARVNSLNAGDAKGIINDGVFEILPRKAKRGTNYMQDCVSKR